MRKFVPLLAVLAAPAAAQSGAWTVDERAGACTATQPSTTEEGRLSVTYDPSAREVVLTSANRVQSALPAAGSLRLALVFLGDDDDARIDEGWGARQFSYARNGQDVLFTTRFSGAANAEQILDDLASYRSLGLFQGAREPVIAYRLDGLRPAIEQLRSCAARGG